ncbi:FAD/NAD(P)-binding domain-containing protein [Earliella scabrosa]|nr:FAD/NAD(P)-binding domain-containing protein [Earliella scabrosa]
MAKFTVAIVGAGMSGLVFAISLRKLAPDVAFDIYEAASELGEIGAGIGVQPRAWAVMQAIGLEDALLKLAGGGERRAVTVTHRKSDQGEGINFSQKEVTETSYTFHRADLQNALLEHLGSAANLHLGKRLVSYIQPGDRNGTACPIELRFQDCAGAVCDVLVGADGVRSAVRGAMYSQLADAAFEAGREQEATALRSHVRPVHSGLVVYRSLIRKEDLSQEEGAHPALNRQGVMLYCGKNKHVVTYLVSQGRAMNVLVDVAEGEEGTVYEGPWTASARSDEVVKQFSCWEPDVQQIMKHFSPSSKWTIGVVTKLPTYVHGRVALMGDAAHAMTPYQGAGAGQGFEDAYMLAQLLGRPDVDRRTLPDALRAYDEVRRPFSQNVAQCSDMGGKTMQLRSPEFVALTGEESATGDALSPEQLREIGVAIEQASEWRFASTIEEDKVYAFRKLEEAIGGRVR